jgi:hypothetical protein
MEKFLFMEAWLDMYNEKIIDIKTNEEILRPYTEEEIAVVEACIAQAVSSKLEDEKKMVDKAAILNRLGISAEEAALLLS